MPRTGPKTNLEKGNTEVFTRTRPWLRFIEGAQGGGSGSAGDNSGGEPNGDTTNQVQGDTNDDGAGAGEVDWKAKAEDWKKFARTWETRAKENQDKAKRLDDLESQSKSDIEKANDRIAELESKLSESGIASLRADVAAEFGVSKEDRDLYLTATDEETLRKQAEGLAKRSGPENPHQGRGGSGPNRKSAEDWAKSLL